jgi:hypothetical protein
MIECFDWEVAKKQMETDIKIDTYKELRWEILSPGWLKQQLWLQG